MQTAPDGIPREAAAGSVVPVIGSSATDLAAVAKGDGELQMNFVVLEEMKENGR